MNLDSILKKGKTIGISGHIRPDGDCVGSTLGLYNYIKKNYSDIDVKIYLEDAPEVFHFLPNYNEICHSNAEDSVFDVYFSLDCGAKDRLGDFEKYFDQAKYKVCIDHHKSNVGFADENYIVPNASSASELVFNLLDRDKIDSDVAQCLYVGIVHDTGIFQFNSTSSHTMEIAGFLMDKGIAFNKIVDETYNKKTHAQNRILGKALLDSKLYLDGKVIASVVTKDDMDAFGVTKADLDGIVNQLRVTNGVEVAIFISELKDEYKASLRGNGKVDLSIISGKYGGGGHFMASGLSFKGNVDDMIQRLIVDIDNQLKEKEC